MGARPTLLLAIAAAAILVGVLSVRVPAAIVDASAGALLHPARHRALREPPNRCVNESIAGDSVTLAAWRCHASGPLRGTVVYLHGVADNRASAAGWIDLLTARGFDVVAYDSRAHGESTGDACTYGYFEKRDLSRAMDSARAKPIVLIGTSLGAAVAIQTAAVDPRVAVVVAAETFSDLRTVAIERAPRMLTPGLIQRAFAAAEREGRFEVDAVSPVAAAAHVTVPVLLVHGAEDVDTPPDHSRRVFAALAGEKKLILVPNAGHNHSMNRGVWPDVERWIASAVTTSARSR